ncbi:MAG: hypothetical protein EOO38_05500 [Cytophagaceae bacterium]|nr:MAG: hypothetical protein EOO38_05500 [Cytophagaceae bacterium]
MQLLLRYMLCLGLVSFFSLPAHALPREETSRPVSTNSGAPCWLYTQGSHIRKCDGQIWQGHGANLQDTRSCESCLVRPDVKEVIRRIDALTDDWHADFIRLTMENWFQSGVLTDPGYLSDLHKIIDHIGTKKNVYVMLAMWHDPTLDGHGWPTMAAAPIWERIVADFGDRPYVMFGLSNEPERNSDGTLDNQVWMHMEKLVQVIRKAEKAHHVPEHIIAVQATRNWARTLDYYIDHPIAASSGRNIIYETHIYNPETDFDALLTTPARTLPVVIGEFGPMSAMSLHDCEKLMQLAESLSVPYLGWTFHSSCAPNLLQNLSEHTCSRGEPLVPTQWGSLLKTHLERLASPPDMQR